MTVIVKQFTEHQAVIGKGVGKGGAGGASAPPHLSSQY